MKTTTTKTNKIKSNRESEKASNNMKKSQKMIIRVLNLQASYIRACVTLSYVRLYADNTTEKRQYIFDKLNTSKLKSARTFKEFTSVANNFLHAESLDAQARKDMLTKNTHYDKTHTCLASFMNKSDFVASNDRRKVEVKKTIKKVASAKKVAKKVAKKTSAKKVAQIVAQVAQA